MSDDPKYGQMAFEPGAVVNALTVDVEDYFHVSAFAQDVRKSEWGEYESRVEGNTLRLLNLFDERNVRGTFFVLGWVAERYPSLVREIAARGHEVACHGYSHDLVFKQTPEVFREESIRAKSVIEDLAGSAVRGYRAASYSITRQSLWALDILADAGFDYDSSIFPIRHDRYGISSAPRLPFSIDLGNGSELREFPLSTARVAGLNLPVAGGGYFRLLPYFYTRAGLARVNRNDRAPTVFYLHPWEIDTGQPRLKTSYLSRFRHYTNIERCEHRLVRLLQDFRWAPMADVLDGMTLQSLPVKSLA